MQFFSRMASHASTLTKTSLDNVARVSLFPRRLRAFSDRSSGTCRMAAAFAKATASGIKSG